MIPELKAYTWRAFPSYPWGQSGGARMHRNKSARIARREFLFCAGALLAAPLARAQEGRTYRVAWVLAISPIAELAGPDPAHPITRAFVHEMRALGYVEGRNLVLERRSAEGNPKRYAQILAELRDLRCDVIVTAGNKELNLLTKDMIRRIPVVVFAMGDPLDIGLVDNLARPGGNITGLTVDSGPENEAKRLQLLKEAVPRLARVAYLGTDQAWNSPSGHAARSAAAELGVDLRHVPHTPNDLDHTFAALGGERYDALFASLSSATYGQRHQIIDFTLRARLPAIFPYLQMAALGGLMAYGVNVVDLGRRSAHYVQKILRGANPGDLPIDRPTKFDLVVNLRAAREIGLTLPPSILLRADRTIE